MIAPPPYFEPIREAAARTWEKLESDPEIAGPWRLLFTQVQSPRHVLSELLQNADDAGATETSVLVNERTFVFAHNGVDFTEEHFASLCRFGYSNKRALHTIGFRGIGFKSTFSLGDSVELHTPTLSVEFRREKFTEPHWIPSLSLGNRTEVRVRIGDELRERQIERNLSDWLLSPLSLLFFKHIRKMSIGYRKLIWESLGAGPVPNSEWMALNGNADEAYLIARSSAEAFPDDTLAEIMDERLITEDQLSDFPLCTVEIVIGAKGELFAVLPTGVKTALPFACNAPFIQDPSRLRIKDPEMSPTNRWLLERTGRLAASVMLAWLGQSQATVAERSRAYGGFPDVNRDDNSLEGTCATTVEKAFAKEISDVPLLLTYAGDLAGAKNAVIIPDALLDVWESEQITSFVDNANRPPLSSHVSYSDREKLIHWNLIENIDKQQVLEMLQVKHLPEPESWGRLLKLWAYIAPDVTGYNWRLDKRALRVVPVQGKSVLYASSEVVRLGDKRLLQSDRDWEFLSEHLLVLNQNWPRWLAEQRRVAEEGDSETAKTDVAASLAVLNLIGLNDASDVSAVVGQVAADFFQEKPRTRAECIQLAQIAAKLNATLDASFRFVTQDEHLCTIEQVVLSDSDGKLEALLPQDWRSAHLLHSDYWTSFVSCTKEEWTAWVSSGRAGLHGLVPLMQKASNLWSRPKLIADLQRRGFGGEPSYQYVTDHFEIEDWDFGDIHWRHWAELATNDESIWSQVVDLLLAQPDNFWSKAKSARALHVTTTGNSKAVTNGSILPSWVLKLRELPCLPDTHGNYHRPEALLLRTPETEPVMDVEPFVNGRLDSEASRPLLKLLGVRDKPIGPDSLLDCLRALAKAERPPVHEVEKWYRRLDQLIDSCSTADIANIKQAFRDENILFTENGSWTNVAGVSLSSSNDEAPGAEIIRRSVQDLAMWRKIGVAEHATVELAIAWLMQLPSGMALSKDDLRRVKAHIAVHAVRIWNECGHWLNLAGEWVPSDALAFGLSMQSLVAWNHLHEWVKQKTADFQQLPSDVTGSAPFAEIPSLASQLEERFDGSPHLTGEAKYQPWLKQLGIELGRITLDGADEAVHIRNLGHRLAETNWQVSHELDLVPYIDGVPAGTSRGAEVVWLGTTLFVTDRPHARLAKPVSQELGRAFRRPDIVDAIKMCYDRPVDFVTEYLEENFKLAPRSLSEAATLAVSETVNDGTVPAPSESSRVNEGETETESNAGSEETLRAAEAEEPPVDGTQPHHERPGPKPGKLSIIERFARANGFQRDGDDRFFHPGDGSFITKPHGERFWERRSSKGEVVRYYWAKDHCLESEPLEIDAEIWGRIDRFPDTHAFVLADPQERPIELAGSKLQSMKETGAIKLFPASYRVLYDPSA